MVTNPIQTVERFLDVYETTIEWKAAAESVLTNGVDEAFVLKSAKYYIGGGPAFATALQALKLLNSVRPNASPVSRSPHADEHEWCH